MIDHPLSVLWTVLFYSHWLPTLAHESWPCTFTLPHKILKLDVSISVVWNSFIWMDLTFYPWMIIIVFSCPDTMSSINNWCNLIILHFDCNSIQMKLYLWSFKICILWNVYEFQVSEVSLSRLPNVTSVNYQRLCFEFAIFQFLSLFEVSVDSLRRRSIVFCSKKPKFKKSKCRDGKLYDF